VQRHAGQIASFTGVLNATCNFVLDQVSRGVPLEAAIALAQKHGYAEADPRLDLDGTDAMQKLIILARAAFGHAPAHVFQGGLEPRPGARLVASCDGHRGEVRTAELPDDHPLKSCAGAENRLLIELRNGERIVLSALGAGRWPTAEAVLADLDDLVTSRASREKRRTPSAA
jgi:homoserine dehydrogenase